MICDVCDSDKIELKTRNVSGWPYYLLCLWCGASVGCHPDSYNPLGKFANARTAFLRGKSHECFDLIWKSGLMTRLRAYRWMADILEIEEFHISHCRNDQLVTVIEQSIAYIKKRGVHKVKKGIIKESIKCHVERTKQRERTISRNKQYAKKRRTGGLRNWRND